MDEMSFGMQLNIFLSARKGSKGECAEAIWTDDALE